MFSQSSSVQFGHLKVKKTNKTKMKKITFILAVFTLTALIIPQRSFAQAEAVKSAALVAYAPGNAYSEERAIALRNIFEKNGSPLANQAENFIKYADKYGVDWKLLPAISGLESSFGLHLMPGSHNAYGWGGGHIYFNSWEEGIETITHTLRSNYMDKWGARDVWEIGPIYAESPTWAIRVSSFMDTINKEYIKIRANTLVPNI